MGDDKRLHRRDPERTGPVRSFTDSYISREAARARGETPNSEEPEDATAGEQGVGLAYRVIEQHINDGRRTAAMFNGHAYNTRSATDLLQEAIERTIRCSSELLPLWLEALTSALRIEPPMSSPSPGAASAEDLDRREHPIAVELEMISTKPATVSIDLREDSQRMSLAVLGLRAIDGTKPELSDIELEADPAGSLKLRICIPQSCPPDTFAGVIVNRETGESRGTLTVRVSDP
jgi:hypothetical protein